ncbi:putative aluminum-activated malate transporter [Dioscorea sansibarensis]
MASALAGDTSKRKLLSVHGLLERTKTIPMLLWRSLQKVGRDDPRRTIYALKVGTALTLVSLLYLLDPLYQGIGKDAMWAVMTVVVVFEFTAGATFYKGFNRALGTIFAGSLAFFIECIAEELGTVYRAIFVGGSVFLIGFAATYVRFIPRIKKNYDYGVLIFILTFNLITVSSFRVPHVLRIARDRLYTIAIGCVVCVFMSLFVFPNWSGEELHNSTADKIEALARSIEACVMEYFNADMTKETAEQKSSRDTIKKGYRAVLDSKSVEESLASFASWEPRHSNYRYPWQQYAKLGAILRHFAYTAVALHGCLESEIQTPQSVRSLFREPCSRVAGEVSKILCELAMSIRKRQHCPPDILSDHLHDALHALNSSIKSQPRLFLGTNNAQANSTIFAAQTDQHSSYRTTALPSVKTDVSALLSFRSKREHHSERSTLKPTLSKIAILSLEFSEALPFAAFASLLVEMAVRLDSVIDQVEKLARDAHFKEFTEKNDVKIDVKICDSATVLPTNVACGE